MFSDAVADANSEGAKELHWCSIDTATVGVPNLSAGRYLHDGEAPEGEGPAPTICTLSRYVESSAPDGSIFLCQ